MPANGRWNLTGRLKDNVTVVARCLPHVCIVLMHIFTLPVCSNMPLILTASLLLFPAAVQTVVHVMC
jgi:hypothetical protein